MTPPNSNAAEAHELELAQSEVRHLHLAPNMADETTAGQSDNSRIPELGVPQLTFIKNVIGGEEAGQVHQMDSGRLYSVATGIYRIFRQVQEGGRTYSDSDVAEKHAARLKLFLLEGSSYREIAESEGEEYNKIHASLGNVAQRLARNLPEETKLALVEDPEQASYTPPITETGKTNSSSNSRSDGSEIIANPDNEWQTSTMKRMFTHDLLKPEEEIELAKLIERGDLKAKQRMIEQNIRLIRAPSKALRHIAPQFSESDIIQEGTFGLIRAVEKFDWRKGYRFSTYATLWIQQAIQRGVDNSGYTIRVPVHWQQKNRKIMGAERAIERELRDLELMTIESEEAYEEIESRTGIPIDDIREIKLLTAQIVSLDKPIGEEEGTDFGSQVASNYDVFEEVARADISEIVKGAINSLSERDAKILMMTHGLGDYDRLRPSQIARVLSVTPQTVHNSLNRSNKILKLKLSPLADSVV